MSDLVISWVSLPGGSRELHVNGNYRLVARPTSDGDYLCGGDFNELNNYGSTPRLAAINSLRAELENQELVCSNLRELIGAIEVLPDANT